MLEALRRNPILALSAGVSLAVLIVAVFGNVLAPHDPAAVHLDLRLHPPSKSFPLGNDALGRCLLSRILSGARLSIGLGLAIVFFSALFRTLVGLVSGYAGRFLDEALMRIVDLFLSFPELIASMAVAGLMGPGTFNLVLALSATSWMRYARVVRSIALSVKERDYVKAARLAGLSGRAIVLRHILPACLPSTAVLATIGLAKSILAVSALGFLGFGVQPPEAEWGTLLMEGRAYILSAPHLCLYPGLAVVVSVLAFNVLGDGLGILFFAARER